MVERHRAAVAPRVEVRSRDAEKCVHPHDELRPRERDLEPGGAAHVAHGGVSAFEREKIHRAPGGNAARSQAEARRALDRREEARRDRFEENVLLG